MMSNILLSTEKSEDIGMFGEKTFLYKQVGGHCNGWHNKRKVTENETVIYFFSVDNFYIDIVQQQNRKHK